MKHLKPVFDSFKGKARSRQVSAAFMAVGAALAMTPVALATDGGGSGGGMSAVLGAFDTVTSLMNSVWTLMTSNPLLTLFLAAGLLTIGVRAFRQIKRAAKG